MASEILPPQDFKSQGHYSKVNQDHTMMLHMYTPNQCSYQSISYPLQFLRYIPEKILKLMVTMARSKLESSPHHNVANLHPQPMSLPSFNFLHLMVSEIQPRQVFFSSLACTPILDAMGENNTPIALKGYGVKIK